MKPFWCVKFQEKIREMDNVYPTSIIRLHPVDFKSTILLLTSHSLSRNKRTKINIELTQVLTGHHQGTLFINVLIILCGDQPVIIFQRGERNERENPQIYSTCIILSEQPGT